MFIIRIYLSLQIDQDTSPEMMDSEQRESSMLSEIRDIYSRDVFTDCMLVAGAARIRCHSVMLASASPMFRTILHHPREDCEERIQW